jgi:hypothetical protein
MLCWRPRQCVVLSQSHPCLTLPKKVNGTKKAKNVFFDNRSFPDELDEYAQLLHNFDGGVILWKKKFPTPPLNDINTDFNWTHSEELHGEKLRTDLNLSHLLPEQATTLCVCF